jgi:hypothetical protein
MKTIRMGKMSGNGSINDACFVQTVKPPETGQTGHEISLAWKGTKPPCRLPSSFLCFYP